MVHPITGTPQGGVISPVLANIYLHYALDLWMEKVALKQCWGKATYVRYADDFIIGCVDERDARKIEGELPGRLGKFKLEVAEEKTRRIRFWSGDLDGSKPFTFLGFDFYWGRSFKTRPCPCSRGEPTRRSSGWACKGWETGCERTARYG